MDEAMVPFQGRSNFKKALPKPISKGIKLWVVVDYETCLILGLQPNDGRHGADLHQDEPVGATGAAVLDMVKPWYGTNACIVTDKEYTSPALAIELLDKGLFSIGTVKASRVPKDLSAFFKTHGATGQVVRAGAAGGKLLVRKGKPQRGDYVIYKHDTRGLYIVLAQDTGKVMLVDTMIGHKQQALERRDKHHGAEVIDLTGPGAWAAHNAFKGGVDQSDQVRCNPYNGRAMHGRTQRWPLRLAYGGVLDVATTNTYQMFRFIRLMLGRPAMAMDDVMAEVERGLMATAYELDALSVEVRGRLHPRDLSVERGTGARSMPEVFQRFEEWMQGHELVPMLGHRQTREGEDSTRHTRARCAFWDCHCRKSESKVTHAVYHESRSVGQECSRCAIPLHVNCFLKHHMELFKREISN
jgi:hypothetical protein